MIQKKNIIIITYHMIPNSKIWGASQRMYYLANHLSDFGYNVTLYHANFGYFPIKDKEFKFNSINVDIDFRLLQKYQERMQIADNATSTNNINLKNFLISSFLKIFAKPIYRKFEKLIFNDYGYIGLFVYFWSRSVWKVLSTNLDSSKVDAVIISGPYFTSFRLLKLIKKYYNNIFCILDYRDPWNLLNSGSFLSYYFEKKFLDLSDLVTVFSDKFKADMIRHFGVNEFKFLTIYNGFDSDTWNYFEHSFLTADSSLPSNNKRMVISYIGSHITFSSGSGRDPSLLIESLSKSNISKFIELNLVGCHDIPKLKTSINSDFIVNYYPVVSHFEALSFLKKSDVTVILSSDERPSKYTLTGKLFDCIRSNVYILGISNSDDVDYIDVINRLKIGSTCKNDLYSLNAKFDEIFMLWKCNRLKRPYLTNLYDYSRQSQNKKLIDVINMHSIS